MLNVFDRFSRESQDLLYSLQRAGYRHPTIVLEANGFMKCGYIRWTGESFFGMTLQRCVKKQWITG